MTGGGGAEGGAGGATQGSEGRGTTPGGEGRGWRQGGGMTKGIDTMRRIDKEGRDDEVGDNAEGGKRR